MTLNDIATILENRIIALTETRKSAVANGNLEQVVSIDRDLASTLDSLDSIRKQLAALQ